MLRFTGTASVVKSLQGGRTLEKRVVLLHATPCKSTQGIQESMCAFNYGVRVVENLKHTRAGYLPRENMVDSDQITRRAP